MEHSELHADLRPVSPVMSRVRAAWSSAGRPVRSISVFAIVTSAALPAVFALGRSFARAVVDVTPELAAGSGVAGAILAVAALVDLHEHRLPSVLLAGAMGSAAIGVGCHASVAADAEPLLSMLVGLLLCGGVMLGVWCTRGIGMGDVKMAAVVGAATAPLSVMAAPVALAIGAATAGLWGLIARRRVLPLGPFLWLGWAVASYGVVLGWLR